MAQLTPEDLKALRAHFKASDHEFIRKFAYITEGAIATRIEDIDPEWAFEILNMATRDKQVICHARMMIKGVCRDGIGMHTILQNEHGEPEKSAATDAFKRCARLFGVGRYLLDLPSGIDDKAKMQTWLDNPTTDDARQALGTGGNRRVANGNESEAESSSEGLPAHLTKLVAIKPTNKGKDMYCFETKSGHKVNAFASEPFIKAGYIDDKQEWIDALSTGSPLTFTVPIEVTLMKKGEFFNIVEVVPYNVDF